MVISGGYSDKIRRTMFAQLAKLIKEGVVSQQEVARAVAELNTFLYRVIVEKLKLEKTDPIRLEISYVIKDGKVMWDMASLKIEAYKPIPQNIIDLAIEYAKTMTEIQEEEKKEFQYQET